MFYVSEILQSYPSHVQISGVIFNKNCYEVTLMALDPGKILVNTNFTVAVKGLRPIHTNKNIVLEIRYNMEVV